MKKKSIKNKKNQAKSQAFLDMQKEKICPFLPFNRWLNRYIFS